MSKIMRELEREGRAARAAAAKAAKEPPKPPEQPELLIDFVLEDADGICRHGIQLDATCFACGRFGTTLAP